MITIRYKYFYLYIYRRYNFDGLDLDWEYPALRGGKPSDKENFVLLVKELKEELKKYRLLLTSALGASKVTIDKAYDVKELTKYLDFMHIMCYDYGGSWDRKVSPNAPLSNYGILNVVSIYIYITCDLKNIIISQSKMF